ncbi:uncharacterized protein LOC122361618 [Puntigrus tetrazona]|uniref:uncharacterized protein LOC122361618 n=1 Tax=Puntigrus tetrazona TaxID=1606681 RepID=UPI001C8AAE00|nr:uncharacterized protein LOC122361618 [Puntigrus tetrazona]
MCYFRCFRLLSTLNLHPNCSSNEDNQSVCSIHQIPDESHNFLSPNHEKFTYCKRVGGAVSFKPKNLTEEWNISPLETKPEFVRLEDSEASGTSSFLQLQPLRRAFSRSRVKEVQEDFCCVSEDAVDQPEILTSCALTDTVQDLLAHLQHADREPCHASSLSALQSDLSLIHLSQRSHQLQNPVHSRELSVSQQASTGRLSAVTQSKTCQRGSLKVTVNQTDRGPTSH